MHYSPTAQAIALLDTAERAGEQIRSDFRALKGVHIGSFYPIESTWHGRKSWFFVAQLKTNTRGNREKLHIRQIRAGKVYAGDPFTYNMYGYEVTKDNELVNKGFMHEATEQEIADWKKAGFPLPELPE